MIPYTEVKNLDVWKDWLKNWNNSGQYEKDINDKLTLAYQVVQNAIGDNMAAVIFDIDETLITEYSLMLKYDFGWPQQAIDEAQITTTFPAIQVVQDFYNYCIANKINVIILTSKRQKYYDYVLQELSFAKYQLPTKLILRPDDDTETIAAFKAGMRQNLIEAQGYRIIANVGDQPSDFYKGYAEYDIEIPNKYYDISIEMVEEHE
ncbi:hypothetical protein LLG34_04330 [bacterium]|nr:hypothetical protein [bacterium]